MATPLSGALCAWRRFPCYQAATSREPGERSPDRDLRSHSLTGLLRELGDGPAQDWQRQARLLDTLYAPTRCPDALDDELPADVFGPEDAAALEAATA